MRASKLCTYSMRQAFTPDDFGHALYPDLNVLPGDLTVRKTRFSALVQGASDLGAILRIRGIDTLIIVGTATNVCCESTGTSKQAREGNSPPRVPSARLCAIRMPTSTTGPYRCAPIALGAP